MGYAPASMHTHTPVACSGDHRHVPGPGGKPVPEVGKWSPPPSDRSLHTQHMHAQRLALGTAQLTTLVCSPRALRRCGCVSTVAPFLGGWRRASSSLRPTPAASLTLCTPAGMGSGVHQPYRHWFLWQHLTPQLPTLDKGLLALFTK